jgi:hypothetical protein
MIEFLKQSTFEVSEVTQKAWNITMRNYVSIALLCFLMFAALGLSSLFAVFLGDLNPFLKFLLFVIFIGFYLVVNLTLLKYIFYLIDHDEDHLSIKDSLPTRKQIVNFLIGNLLFTVSILAVYIVVTLLVFPFIYTGYNLQIFINIAISLGLVAIFITWIRISFFPFFIIDRNLSPFTSLKFSLAITKGNFTKIVILLFFLASFQLLYLCLNYFDLSFFATFVNVISSFVVIPLSSVALALAYRQMMKDYKGQEQPDILHNII